MKLFANRFSQVSKTHTILFCVILIVFAIIYSLLSITNHYLFRSSAYDLGMFNHALYCFAHFKANYFTLDLHGNEINYFGDHFSPITLFYAPFYYLFGSYTLLIIQIASILVGGVGIYRYASLTIETASIRLIILVHFFFIWGIYSALSFDFHNNVVGAMIVPWLFYCHELKNKKVFALLLVLILFTKENMALWMAFILLGLIAKEGFKDRKQFYFHLSLFAFSIVYFLFIVGFIMPYIRHGEGPDQMARYTHLGNSFSEIFINLISSPRNTFSLLFENNLPESFFDGIKMETHLMVLGSGGILLFVRPYYFIMLIPIYAQKMFTNDYVFWGINLHYSIEFVPILSLCLVDFLKTNRSLKIKYAIAWLVTISTTYFTFSSMFERKSVWYSRSETIFWQDHHYTTSVPVKEIYKALKIIDPNASISASTTLVPHLAFRDKIYHFPIVKNADYIVLMNDETYPLSMEEFEKKETEYKNSPEYITEYDKNNLLILKRKK